MEHHTITCPSGRVAHYETSGTTAERLDRIQNVTELLCDSLTTDGNEENHLDNLFAAATMLFIELSEVNAAYGGDAIKSTCRGLSRWITRNAPEEA